MKFLDCTLRDGGYYNNWDFDLDNAEKLVQALNDAGVDIIEVGYKSLPSDKEYFGLFKYCNEDFLSFLGKYTKSQYAFMVDVKEFLVDSIINFEKLDSVIRPVSDSYFSWVRLATHFNTIECIPTFTKYFRDKGYQVGYNLMGGSLLSDENLIEGITIASKAGVDVFYIADSFGSFYPSDIKRLVLLCKEHFKGKIGVHTHDNQGMAYANTLAAVDAGANFIDGTITGMGRGAGNLQTEQFLLGNLRNKEKGNGNFNTLLNVINDYFLPLKSKYRWGFSPSYMLSGIYNIHPTYCQKLEESNRYTSQEVASILTIIPKENRSKYNSDVLDNATKKFINKNILDNPEFKNIVGFHGINNADKCLIVAGGPTAEKHIQGIQQYLDNNNECLLIEVNDTELFQKQTNRITVLLNKQRLLEYLGGKKELHPELIITGQDKLPSKFAFGYVKRVPVKIAEVGFDRDILNMPDYDAGIMAIMLALKAEIKEIYLAGFDGTKDKEHNGVMNNFFAWVSTYAAEKNIRISAVTPTQYKNISISSIYTI